MIDYEAESCLPTSPAKVLQLVTSFLYWHDEARLPQAYIDHICQYHGGVPRKKCFPIPNGQVRVVGRFFNFLEQADPSPPKIPSWRFTGMDARLDYSIWYLMESVCEEPMPIVPFAGIDSEGVDCRKMQPFNMLCFDQQGRVVFFAPGFGVVQSVASSFEAFADLLQESGNPIAQEHITTY